MVNDLGCSLAGKSDDYYDDMMMNEQNKMPVWHKDNNKCCGLAKVRNLMLLYTPVYLQFWLLGRRKGIPEVVQNVLLQQAIPT